MNAIVTKWPEITYLPTIKDPMNKTLHMSIRKAKRRRERQEAKRGKLFNPIKGWEKLGV